ncbi:C40 family peptidase [Haloechinothrix halophila]|uniref:C40 family peptidase n=1 Tax=Haloechinothrix halophila TaxID=1069073 RepID=UPI00040CA2D3|nr:NlpC/P60 family protein [Haloechinothrix halophila]
MTPAAKLAAGATAAVLVLPLLLLSAALGALTGATPHRSAPSDAALADIPPDYLDHYTHAATVCPGLDWTILAAIGAIESDHGRSTLPGVHNGHNGVLGSDGARGPLQFLPATFADVRREHPDVGPDIYDPANAALAAAWYLCDSGARSSRDLRGAIFTYNRADWYVNTVLAQATAYRSSYSGGGDCDAIQAPTPATRTAIAYACQQIGLPYLWGGDGPDAGDTGFDCSGLTTAAYNTAGVSLPRTAHTQYHHGPRVPAGEPLQPGDLVFYGNPNTKGTAPGSVDSLAVRIRPHWKDDRYAEAVPCRVPS